MPQTSATKKKLTGEQSDGGSGSKSSRPKSSKSPEQQSDTKKVKKSKEEISVPIVYGTIFFWLGKKASEYNSRKWTVYVRSATNDDLSVVVKRVVFQLHPSFNNPTRVVETPPFELSESGWGEFEIAISLFFRSDVCDKKLDVYHHLKLYLEEESGPQSTKKLVVVELYDEVVFPDPSESFLARVQNHPAVIVPRNFILPSGLGDNILERKRAARQQVQTHIVKLKRQLSLMEGQPQQPKFISNQ